jgi:hypothetical protein
MYIQIFVTNIVLWIHLELYRLVQNNITAVRCHGMITFAIIQVYALLHG